MFSFRLKKLVGRAQSVCLWKLSFFLCLLWTTIQSLRHISAALSARKPEYWNSLAVLGARREERRSIVGVLCSGCSWHMIHQGLVPSGIDESLSHYSVFIRNRDLEEYHKAMISLTVQISLLHYKPHMERLATSKITFSRLSNAQSTNTWFSGSL